MPRSRTNGESSHLASTTHTRSVARRRTPTNPTSRSSPLPQSQSNRVLDGLWMCPHHSFDVYSGHFPLIQAHPTEFWTGYREL